jgi:hypothetical protein
MTEPHLDAPADIRELVGKTIDQTERAFSFFFDAANAPLVSDAAKTVLSVAQQNVKAAFDHARKLANAKDLAAVSDAICFTKGRIRFEAPDGTLAAPTQGQAYFYFGEDMPKFSEVFASLGFVT